METKFTPGPWQVDRNKRGVLGDKGLPVAMAFSDDFDDEVQQANARLIAEAPVMFALLERIDADNWESRDYMNMVAEIKSAARAILAKLKV